MEINWIRVSEIFFQALLTGFISGIVVFTTFRLGEWQANKNWKRELAQRETELNDRQKSEQVSNVPKFIREEYWSRQISPPIIIGEEKVTNLQNARVHILEDTKQVGTETEEEALIRFLGETTKIKTWQNRIAYQISLGVNQVGLQVLSGGLPLTLVLTVSAYQIMDDWLYCSKLVNDVMRIPQNITPKSEKFSDEIGFHRLHGEWLAYACAIYINKYWQGDQIGKKIELLGGIDHIRHREKIIRKFITQTKLIPNSTQILIASEFGKI